TPCPRAHAIASSISAEPTPRPRHSGATAIPREATWRVTGCSSRDTERCPITRLAWIATRFASSFVHDDRNRLRKVRTVPWTASERTNDRSPTTVCQRARNARASAGVAGRTMNPSAVPVIDTLHRLRRADADHLERGGEHLLRRDAEPEARLRPFRVVG